MIFSEFTQLVGQALTPITMISGVGILMLCMTFRYNHASDRIRQLIEKREEASGTSKEPDLDAELDLIFHRAALLRTATLFVVFSAFCSALLVFGGVLGGLLGFPMDVFQSVMLCLSICGIIGSTSFFAAEISVSLHALALVIEHLPPLSETGEPLEHATKA